MSTPTGDRPSMPFGVRFFLVYAFLVLGGIGVSLRWVVDLAVEMAVSPLGVVWMAGLAYTIFTITLVLQRKQAGRGFALGLSTLTLPLVLLLLLSGTGPGLVASGAVGLVAATLFRGLTRPDARAYLAEL